MLVALAEQFLTGGIFLYFVIPYLKAVERYLHAGSLPCERGGGPIPNMPEYALGLAQARGLI